MDTELFDAPFNLAGELLDNSITAEGEARVRALAESEARKAQQTFEIFASEIEREYSN
jgi:broad specificity phosphatase PhoE